MKKPDLTAFFALPNLHGWHLIMLVFPVFVATLFAGINGELIGEKGTNKK